MSPIELKIREIQEKLAGEGADGWLLYDHHGSNRFVRQILDISPEQVLTRRFFYWIPKKGEPEIILHQIEGESLGEIPGHKYLYLSWKQLEEGLKKILRKAKTILMEYSPRGANPYVSVVDAGTIEIIREMGIEIISSANLLQYFTSVLSSEQINTHKQAASIVQKIVDKAWDLIGERLQKGQPISEYDVQNFILSEFTAHHCVTEGGPICAVNEHSAIPHYIATKYNTKMIERGDFILIDLWCKKDLSNAIYADITRVAVAAPEPTPKQQAIFDIVQTAQQKGIDFVVEMFGKQKVIKGAQVDDVCREYIKSQGYGDYFTHRVGHNLDTEVHGAGAHLDNLETSDQRQLLPGMCFTIEPGIYLVGDFGVRTETNLLLKQDHSVEITGGLEKSIFCLV